MNQQVPPNYNHPAYHPQTPPPAPQFYIQPQRVYKTSHGFHLLMSLLTLGLWVPVWIIVGIVNAARS